jgi:hypothetical protein
MIFAKVFTCSCFLIAGVIGWAIICDKWDRWWRKMAGDYKIGTERYNRWREWGDIMEICSFILYWGVVLGVVGEIIW